MNFSFFNFLRGALPVSLALASPSPLSATPQIPPPTSSLQDDANLFSRDQSAEISHSINTSASRGAASFLLLTKYYIPDEETSPLAQRLLHSQFPDSPAFIFLYSRGNDRLSVSGNEHVELLLAKAEIQALSEEAIRSALADPQRDASSRLTAILPVLASSLSERLRSLQTHADSARLATLPLALAIALSLLTLAALAASVSVAITRRRTRIDSFAFFPPVHVSQRFGAPCGGGTVALSLPAQSPHPAPPSPVPRSSTPPQPSYATVPAHLMSARPTIPSVTSREVSPDSAHPDSMARTFLPFPSQ